MNPENIYDHPNYLNLENEVHDWHLIDPMLHVRRLNRIFKRKEVQEAYHLAALGYDSIERFDVLQCSDYTRYPKWKAQPREGAQYLTPADCDRSDWRWWDRPQGRPPLYLQYVCARACHWLCPANLLVAQALFPHLNWVVLSSEFHSTVACLDERLLFDLNYSSAALDVSASAAIEMLLKHEDGVFIYEADEVEQSEKTMMAIELFRLADESSLPEEEMLQGFRNLVDDDEAIVLECPMAKELVELECAC